MKLLSIFLILIFLTSCKNPEPPVKETTNSSQKSSFYNLYMENPNYELSKYEPKSGTYLSSYFKPENNIKETTENFENLTNNHVIYSSEIKLDDAFPRNLILTYYSKGKIPYITINPPENLEETFNIDLLKNMAQSFGSLNIPMFVNFYENPHNNNFNENEYISFFKQAKVFFQIYAPNVAFIWSINSENAYELDKFYPGDFYVDWVGLNIYETAESSYINKIQVELDYFYQNFQHKKPICINLGISHFNSKNVNYIINEKIDELNRFFNKIPKKYNRVKLINYLNSSNFKNFDGSFENFSITDNKEILNSYNKLIENELFIRDFNSDLKNILLQENLLFKFLIYEKNNKFFIFSDNLDELLFNLKINSFNKQNYEINSINNKNYYNLEEILNDLNYKLIVDEDNLALYIKQNYT